MKKSILFTALVALLVATSCAGSDTTSEENATPSKKKVHKRQGLDEDEYTDKDGLGYVYGDVESITRICYEAIDKFGEIVKGNISYKVIYKFNLNGDLVEKAEYYPDGSSEKYFFKYNSQNKLIEEASYLSHHSSENGKTIYKYDAQGNMIEMARYKSDGSLSWKELYKYDARGNMVELAYAHYESDGWRGKEHYKYDSQGNKIEEARYNSDGSLSYKEIYKYDSQGNMIEKARYTPDGSLSNKTIYKYDSQGNMIEWVEDMTDVGWNDRRTTYQYDAQGNCIKETCYYEQDNGAPGHQELCKYDAQGNMIEWIYYSGRSLYKKKLFKYDSQGNQIGAIQYKGDMMDPDYIEERIVVYRK